MTTPFLAATSAYHTAAARQADGKVVTATVIQSSRAGVALTRFNADGTIDATFGDGGTALLDVDTYWGSPIDLAIDSRGRIVVSVQGRISAPAPLACRAATSDGRADTTFGDGGVVRLDAIEPTFISETSLAFQGQKILLGFGREGSGLTVARVRRRRPSRHHLRRRRTRDHPRPDRLPRRPGLHPRHPRPRRRRRLDRPRRLLRRVPSVLARSLAVRLPDRRAGRRRWHTPDGQPDATFGGGDGVVVPDLGAGPNGLSIATDVVLLPDGRIAVLGDYTPDVRLSTLRRRGPARRRRPDVPPTTARLTRLLGAAGASRDSTSPTAPASTRSTNPVRCSSSATASCSSSAGQAFPASSRCLTRLARLTAAGQLDPTFGVAGRVTTAVPDHYVRSPRAVLEPDGGILLVANAGGHSGPDTVVLTRYLADNAPAVTAAIQGGVLRVTGTAAADTIVLRERNGRVEVVGLPGTFDAGLFSRVEILGLGGDDRLDLSNLIKPATVDAGDGNDVVLGGSGDDSLLGDAGTTRSSAATVTTRSAAATATTTSTAAAIPIRFSATRATTRSSPSIRTRTRSTAAPGLTA